MCQFLQGHPRLVKAIGAFYSKLLERDINPMSEVFDHNYYR